MDFFNLKRKQKNEKMQKENQNNFTEVSNLFCRFIKNFINDFNPLSGAAGN